MRPLEDGGMVQKSMLQEIEISMHGIDKNHPVWDRVFSVILEFARRIPPEDWCTILERNIHFVLPFKTFAMLIPTQDNKPVNLVVLGPDHLRELKPLELLYVVAHECAHVYLNHGEERERCFEGTTDVAELERLRMIRELEADAQVIRWGFGEALEATPFNYLLGKRNDLVDNVNEVKATKDNSKSYTVSRLQRQRLDLDSSPVFTERNFRLSDYRDSRQRTCYVPGHLHTLTNGRFTSATVRMAKKWP